MPFQVAKRTTPTVTYALYSTSLGTTLTQLYVPNTQFATCYITAGVTNGSFAASGTATAEL